MDPREHTPKGMRYVFGIFMILFYVAVGCLFIFQVFTLFNTALSVICGALLILYGIFRAYRMYRTGY